MFNESQRLSSRCLESAVQCLLILVSRGWRQKLLPQLGKQLLILLSLLAGGSPGHPKEHPPSEELLCACFECMSNLFNYLGQAEQHILDETGADTIVDQTVYLLLEAITDNSSDNVQLSATNALQTLLSQINNRVLLASLLPRTVSALTKSLRQTTQTRRTHKTLAAMLRTLSHILQAVLADEVALPEAMSRSVERTPSRRLPGLAEESTILDDKWLRATSSQVKLALVNVVKLRNHGRLEVQQALFNMCLMICQQCARTLSESLQLIVETMIILASLALECGSVREMQTLKHLIVSNADVTDLMRNRLDAWINALPRLMRRNEDRPKRQVLSQISTALQILGDSGHASELLNDSLAISLVESVSAAIEVSSSKPLKPISEAPSPSQIVHLPEQAEVARFQPVVLDQKIQLESLVELHALIGQIRGSSASEPLTRLIMGSIGQPSGSQQVAALWLSLNLLRNDNSSFLISDLIHMSDEPFDTTPYLISDLYSITLPLLLDSSMTSFIKDWRVSALTLESTILQANQLGNSYRAELVDTLYPILSLLGSPESRLQSHAMTALNLLAAACEYPDTSTMLVENVDYLINSIALKLNTFDISPQGPQMLLMLLQLCGARIIPYLDDLICSIFGVLDNFHGYPRLVELLFEVLRVIVDEAAKNPALTISSGLEEPRHRKTSYLPSSLGDIVQAIREHGKRKERLKAESAVEQAGESTQRSAPHRPWTSDVDGSQPCTQDPEEQQSELDNNEEPTDIQSGEQKEAPLSKPHALLLSIARSTIPHLSAPSSRVRCTLLQLLTRTTSILAYHENSFLPLVNDIWPAILPRLFSLESRSTTDCEDGEPEDPAYVNVAAADTIAAICACAGDFMSGRVEDIFPSLERMYNKIWAEVEQDRRRMAQQRGSIRKPAIGSNESLSAGEDLRGTIDLQIVNTSSRTTALDTPNNKTSTNSIGLQNSPSPHTAPTRLHGSLLPLLITILTHVRVPDSIGDSILSLLGPIMDEPGREDVRSALETWNADAVWVVRERTKIEREMAEGVREVGDWRWGGNSAKPAPVTGSDGKVWEFSDVVF